MLLLFNGHLTQKRSHNSPQKTYINLYFFQISLGVWFTYIYLFASILLNIVNRFLYQKYNFKFTFTLMFIQQFFCFWFFTFIARKNENFKSKAGEISCQDFLRLKYQYIFFCVLFTFNSFSSFIGNQLVLNTAMFWMLRKFLTVMNYLYDRFINKKTLPSHFGLSATWITLGTVVSGYDDLTADLFGYFVVFINNTLSVLYGQMSDKFSKKNGVSNIKLLIYNSYLVTPLLFIAILVSGEYKRLVQMFFDPSHDRNWWLGCGCTLLLSCSLCIVLNSSYWISNEQNSSLFTQLLSSCKDVFVSGISLVVLKDFTLTFKTGFGMILSTFGALLFSFKTMWDNWKFGGNEKEKRK